MLSAKARMRPLLDARLSILATIGSNAPFVGLLGTVLGIIKAAHDLTAAGGEGNPNAVMAGVFEALVATAVGLFVAIPAVVAFNLFQRRVRKTLAQVDSLAHLVLANVRAEPTAGTGRRTPTARLLRGSRNGRQVSSGFSDDDDGRHERHQRHAAGGRDAGAVDRVHDHRAGDRRQRPDQGRICPRRAPFRPWSSSCRWTFS